ncbi:hypothetical protein SELR_pSRC400370 (plasmid) [Selenomonas ruminantium subsp. lactilytica TAM6421]|uniref:Uncharacterized protein n=1 Tax=Selenomonas ruminantium subsp. lactilytica (strain NBRC 103574 / TAM6421) TaxID=927704 RepID=I0GVA1_SELRL|nr:hypothetical protein [Selenomonas ruminantium]BAL84688.1 hypothetical protein SELR_pSRC400370 [Selenomonas ruminantium subsp. lactilytica TAM6421]
MFFLFPMSLGATIFVFSCIGITVCFSIPAVWAGLGLGTLATGTQHVLLRVANLKHLSLALVTAPIVAFWLLLIKNKLKYKVDWKELAKAMTMSLVLLLPFTSFAAYLFVTNCLDPNSATSWAVNVPPREQSIMWAQIADQQARCETFIEAQRALLDIIDYSLIALILLAIKTVAFGYYNSIKDHETGKLAFFEPKHEYEIKQEIYKHSQKWG